VRGGCQDKPPKLSKEDEAAVRAQLEKEAAVRARVARARTHGTAALAVVAAMMAAAPATQPALHAYIPPVVRAMVLPLLGSPHLHTEAGEFFVVRVLL
jgi:FtsH-binding integral membrane protein